MIYKAVDCLQYVKSNTIQICSHLEYLMQVVYNANKLAKLVKEKKSKQNWLDYYELKYSRNQSKRPVKKVHLCNVMSPINSISRVLYSMLLFSYSFGAMLFLRSADTFHCIFIFYWQTGFLGLCGEKVDAIDFETSEIKRLSKEVISHCCSSLSYLIMFISSLRISMPCYFVS